MKKDIVEFIKTKVGVACSEYLEGFGGWLNGKVISVSEQGDLSLEFEVREDMLNPLGTIHGGAIAAILDEVMGTQLFLKSDNNDRYFSLNIAVDFTKNAKLGERLKVIPILVRKGKKTATLRADIYNEKELLVAQASSNFLKLEI